MDTRNKRASAVMVSLPFRGALPLPDGTVDSWDRPTPVFMYNGIGSAEGGGTPTTGSTVGRRVRLWKLLRRT